MSDRDQDFSDAFVDPNDPEAVAREQRRREREERRRQQGRRSEETMRSLADRVGGALGAMRGAAGVERSEERRRERERPEATPSDPGERIERASTRERAHQDRFEEVEEPIEAAEPFGVPETFEEAEPLETPGPHEEDPPSEPPQPFGGDPLGSELPSPEAEDPQWVEEPHESEDPHEADDHLGADPPLGDQDPLGRDFLDGYGEIDQEDEVSTPRPPPPAPIVFNDPVPEPRQEAEPDDQPGEEPEGPPAFWRKPERERGRGVTTDTGFAAIGAAPESPHTAAPVDDSDDTARPLTEHDGGDDGGSGDDGAGGHRLGRAFGGSGGGREMWRRRAVGLLVLVVALGLVGVVGAKVIGSVGGSGDPPAPAPKGPKRLKTIDVTVPEGLTIEQTAAVAKKAGLSGSYEKAAKKELDKFDLGAYDAKSASSLEGFLFPATYNIEKGAPAIDLVDKQLAAFEQNFAGIDLKSAKKKNLTAYDVVSIASMIEKEIADPSERPLASAVIYNRLSDGTPLGIDATLCYELNNYDKPLLESELQADTPYNTRTNTGLPPSPIASPGLASLEAAAAPADKNYLFYVIKPGTCNEHFFTASSTKFDAAVARYQDALAAEGGSPTKC